MWFADVTTAHVVDCLRCERKNGVSAQERGFTIGSAQGPGFTIGRGEDVVKDGVRHRLNGGLLAAILSHPNTD